MNAGRGAVFAASVCLVAALAPAAASGATGTSAIGTPETPTTDRTVTRIAIARNGTATWKIGIWTRLPTDDSVADYERFQRRFRENTSAYLGSFRRNVEGIVADAETETGREMRASDFRASTRIQAVPRRWGIVTYRFRWTNFAAREGEVLVVGDVFRGGFYLTSNDTLAVVAPAGYEVTAALPDPDETGRDRVRGFGRHTFADDRPRIRLEPRTTPSPTPAPVPTTTPTTYSPTPAAGTDRTDGGDSRTTTPGDSGGGPSMTLLGVAAVIVLLGAGTYRYVSAEGDGDGTGTGTDGPAADAAPGPTADAGESPTPGSELEPEPEPISTDEDRIRRLLANHGGQLRQSDIVERLDWSKSKTSRVLSGMAEEGTVEKLRLGRENVIELRDDEAADSDGSADRDDE